MNGEDVGRAIRACEEGGAPTETIVALVNDWPKDKIVEDVMLWSSCDEEGSRDRSESYIANTVLIVAVACPTDIEDWFKAVTAPIRARHDLGHVRYSYLRGTAQGLLMALLWLSSEEARGFFTRDDSPRLDHDKWIAMQQKGARILAETILAFPYCDLEEAGKLAKTYVQKSGLGAEELVDCLARGLSEATDPIYATVYGFVKQIIYARVTKALEVQNSNVLATLLKQV